MCPKLAFTTASSVSAQVSLGGKVRKRVNLKLHSRCLILLFFLDQARDPKVKSAVAKADAKTVRIK